jgi:glycogen debranching enzyme
VSGLIPLTLPDLSAQVVGGLVQTLAGPRFAATNAAVLGVPSFDRTDDRYDPRRYWRGPSWLNTTWLIATGLRRHGYLNEAAKLDRDLVQSVRDQGFREYFNPDTGSGHGTDDFSWSAALVVHLLTRQQGPPGQLVG